VRIGRAVVDDDDLDVTERLGENAVDGFLDVPAEVVAGDDDGDRRAAALIAPP